MRYAYLFQKLQICMMYYVSTIGYNMIVQGGEKRMTSNNKQAKNALGKMKYEVANDLNINLKQGYNGDLTSKQAGSIGGEIVKRLIQQAENQMSNNG